MQHLRQHLQQHLRQFVRRYLSRDLRDLRRRQLQCELSRRLSAAHAWLPTAVSAIILSDLQTPNWQPLYKPARAQRSLALAFDIAQRLAEPGLIETAVASARAGTTEPASIYWHPHGIAQGDAGIALMYGCFDTCFPEQGWDRIAHQWVERAARGAEVMERLPGGLFEGLSGLVLTVHYLSRGGRRYQNLLGQLHAHVVDLMKAQCNALDAAIAVGAVPFGAWDVIAGLTGMGAYFLSRRDDSHLVQILERLVALTGRDEELPSWYTPAEFSSDWMRYSYPQGHLNCGLAHGIPGPLALLSLAQIAGITVPGQQHAIDRIARWLSSHSLRDPWGVNWPAAIPLTNCEGRLIEQAHANLAGTHAGWCYGSPGVARALWLAGQATRNAAYSGLALEAIRAVMRRPPQARGLSSPALCHGLAGLLLIVLRFRRDAREHAFTAFARSLLRQIEALHEPESLLGYRTTEPGGGRIDQAGLLDGAAGIAMAILAASTDRPPDWDRLFLLS